MDTTVVSPPPAKVGVCSIRGTAVADGTLPATPAVKTTVTKLTFPNDASFQRDLRDRVDGYFREKGISKGANGAMWAKTVFWLVFAFGSLLTATLAPMAPGASIALMALAGFGFAGVGMNVSHDAIHGSTSTNKAINGIFSWTFDAIGVSSATWRIAHNLLHHTYTNVPGVDSDIEPGPALRFQPNAKHYPWHRAQAFYAWFLYTLTAILWVYQKDFIQMSQRHPRTGERYPAREWAKLFIGKGLHGVVFIAIPLAFGPQSVPVFIAGYIALLAVGGFTLAVVFQLAHVVEGVRYISPENGTQLPRGWMEHEMLTTANFGRTAFCTFITGGLDHQVEHHLFPNICHIHYRALSPIVKKCAEDHGLPYLHTGSFPEAVASHARIIARLGRNEEVESLAVAVPRDAERAATALAAA